MIQMNKTDLNSQEGMERALREYLDRLTDNGDGTFNGMVAAALDRCDYEKRTLVLRVQTQSWMENPNGVLHGGVSAAILDIAMGTLARYFTGGGMTPTVSMSVNYLRPVPVGAVIYLRAELPMRGFTLCHASCRMWVEGQPDRSLCTATGVYYAASKRL